MWNLKLSVFVDGTPAGQPRVKAMVKNGKTQVYTPDTADAWKDSIILTIRGMVRGRVTPLKGPIFLRTLFFFPRPASGAPTERNRSYFKATKPDFDNLEKAVADAITGSGLWEDDDQVVKNLSFKVLASPEDHVGARIEVFSWEGEPWISHAQLREEFLA